MYPHARLKAVGYWKDGHEGFSRFPRPQWFVGHSWNAADLGRVLAYLRNGHKFRHYGGWSTCRFRGCREGERNGASDFTDGEWTWPEGLAHYVECHALILPESFVATMRANHWQIPELEKLPGRAPFDYTFWLRWTRWQRLRHCYAFWRLAFYRAA